MVITAESGASKTDWIVEGRPFRTKGINFSVMSVRDITSVVSYAANEIRNLTAGDDSPVSLFFYGAGLVSEVNINAMTDILTDFFPGAHVECASDLLAAARALWGDDPGIVAILGTGSNSCRYNGRRIIGNVRPGGYILGDEGGGVSIGKRFISDYIKDLVPESLASMFSERYKLKYADIVGSVYKGQNPAGFLASFAPFVIETAGESNYSGKVVRDSFREFIVRSLLPYRSGDERMEVGVAGSVGYACRDMLMALGEEYNIGFCRFMASPIESLAAYHSDRRGHV